MLRQLVSALFTVFSSNSFCESVFSVVGNVWTTERNRLAIDTLNAIVSVKFNSELSCIKMYEYLLTRQDLLKEAKTIVKYQLNE